MLLQLGEAVCISFCHGEMAIAVRKEISFHTITLFFITGA